MVKVAYTRAACNTLKDLPTAQISPALRAELAASKDDLQKSWKDGLLGERLLSHQILSDGPNTFIKGDSNLNNPLVHLVAAVVGQPFFYWEDLRMFQWHQQIVADPTRNPSTKWDPYLHPFAIQVAPNFAKGYAKVSELTTDLDKLIEAK
jgi:hypothetical protein